MFAKHHIHLTYTEWEMIKWAVLISFASALTLFLAQRAGGDELPAASVSVAGHQEPGLLADELIQAARPMSESPLVQQAAAPMAFTKNLEVWHALDLHRGGQHREAMIVWSWIQLPPERVAWRHIAEAAGYLELGELDHAGVALQKARELAPENALVYYYLAELHMSRSTNAGDALLPPEEMLGDRLVYCSVPPMMSGRMYHKLAAMENYEEAIARSAETRLDLPLVLGGDLEAASRETMPVPPATPADLLEALGNANYVAKSHEGTAWIALEIGALDLAEQHMDRAASLKLSMGQAYTILGWTYEEWGRDVDAARAHLKSMAHGQGLIGPARQILQDLSRAWGS